jgi:hypothetical protein
MTRMSRQDRDLWASARTLADLGELTARWIEGDLASQPGYNGPSDIEDPALVPLLAKLNRAGFVTTCSQIGEDGPGYDGAHWQQRAALEGFASTELARHLYNTTWPAGLFAVACDPARLPRWRYRYREAVVVTRRNGHAVTTFGCHLPRRHIRDDWLGYGMCHPDAVHALCTAWQVTVIDPEWGRPDLLWPVLAGALTPPGRPS